MHHALHVVDLITEIVDEVARHPDFDWPPLPSQQLADLAAMARTCKLFYEPAMNALWKVIHTQFHLIQWLPYWQFIYHSQWEKSQFHLSRLLTNAARARKVRFTEYNELDDRTARMLEAVSSYIPRGESLFPGVRELDICGVGLDVQNYLPMLFNGNIDKLVLISERRATGAALTVAVETCPGLRELLVGNYPSSQETSWLAQLPQLEKLEVWDGDLREADVRSLGYSPHLRVLNIPWPKAGLHTPLAESSSPTFRFLTKLQLSTIPNSDTLVMFLRMISSPNLSYLDLQLATTDSTGSRTSLGEAISMIASFSSLQELYLVSESSPDDVACDIRPLLRLGQLRVFYAVLGEFEAAIHAEVISSFGKAWSHLHSFTYISDMSTRRPSTLLDLNALRLFAHHLPNLRNLSVRLNAATIPLPDTAATSPASLEQLSLKGGSIDPQLSLQIASYIHDIYPRASVYVDGEDSWLEEEEMEGWYEVTDAIATMKHLRMQEDAT